MRSTSLGCMRRRNKNYEITHADLKASKGVNGNRRSVFSPTELCILGFAWSLMIILAFVALYDTARSLFP